MHSSSNSSSNSSSSSRSDSQIGSSSSNSSSNSSSSTKTVSGGTAVESQHTSSHPVVSTVSVAAASEEMECKWYYSFQMECEPLLFDELEDTCLLLL
ncbi:hypothetical protein ACSSS7_004887 [Eimeria intestinalis]